MIDLGLTPAKRATLLRLLRSPHSFRISVQLMTLQETYVSDLSRLLLEGQVNINAKDQVTRSADLTIFDPFRRIQLDPDDPSKVSTGMSDLVKINYIVINPEIPTEAFNIPIFTGPIDSVSRDAVSIKIQCVGKEALAIGNSYVGKIYKKGAKKTDVIRDILRWIIGETRLQIPDLGARLPTDWRLSQGDIPWDAAVRLARGMGYQLFYDGRGTARMRRPGGRALHTFDGLWVTSPPQIAYDTGEVINTVIVKGGKPKKAKNNVSFTAIAAAAHPLSPQKLGRNGVPRFLPMRIEDSSLISVAECRKKAVQELNRGLLLGYDATWDGLPMPLLEEGDIVHVNAHGLRASCALHQFSIPLTISNASYGYNANLKARGGQTGISRGQMAGYQRRAAHWARQIAAADRPRRKKRRRR